MCVHIIKVSDMSKYKIGISGVGYVCHPPHCQYQCSRYCFVGCVIDFSGDLRIWLDTGVTVSDLDVQQGALIV